MRTGCSAKGLLWVVVLFAALASLGLGTCALAATQTAPTSLQSTPQMVGGEAGPASGLNTAPRSSKQVPALLRGVGIDQRLNAQVPLGLVFQDASGKPVRLGDFFGKKPVILSLVYFSCPMLCTMEENSLLQTMRLLQFTAGKEFNVVTVSFDPHDTPEIAANKRRLYLGLYARPSAVKGWHFLTGDETSIKALTDAVGFHYNYDPNTHQFAHAVGIIVLTPDGKVSKYLYGLNFPERDLRLALIQASDEKIGSPVDALILYCCQYDPATGKYGWIIQRVLFLAGLVAVLCIGIMILVLSLGGRHHHPAA
ncbi:MAG TPA: SCO family protein [Terriglobia bacterium]|nr:SCO family protein [Terriglobia bacterium]